MSAAAPVALDPARLDGRAFSRLIAVGGVLGIVGESGCGKSTLARLILGLLQPSAGDIAVEGQRVLDMDRKARARLIQPVFQDPFASLNPRHSVGRIVGEPLWVHGLSSRRRSEPRVRELLKVVGLPADAVSRYPHEFSGGQRQRIGLARALALNPDFLVCDEPVSALDVSIQAGVVNLLEELRARLGLSYLFVAHDLSVVRHIADRVAVMYLGRVAEIGEVDEVYGAPAHPYTQALLSAVPVPDPTAREHRERIILHGDVPSPANIPSGCRFRTRCWKAQDICAEQEPELVDRGQGHPSACHFAETAKVI